MTQMLTKRQDDDNDDLDRLAFEEILKETKRGKERAETMGPIGWVKCPLVPTNKRFFRNVLMGTLASQKHQNKRKDLKRKHERSQHQTEQVSLSATCHKQSRKRLGGNERETNNCTHSTCLPETMEGFYANSKGKGEKVADKLLRMKTRSNDFPTSDGGAKPHRKNKKSKKHKMKRKSRHKHCKEKKKQK